MTDEVKNARAAIKAHEQIERAAIKANKIKKLKDNWNKDVYIFSNYILILNSIFKLFNRV